MGFSSSSSIWFYSEDEEEKDLNSRSQDWIQAGIQFTMMPMNGPENNLPKPKYKWPWFVLAAVVVFIVLAIFWVNLAVQKEEQQLDFGQPLPSGAPAR